MALLVFFTESKNEKEGKGLWVTIHRDEAPWKAYKLLPALVYAMQQQFALMYRFNWTKTKFASLISKETGTGAAYMAMNDLLLITRFPDIFPQWRVKQRVPILIHYVN